MAKRARRKTTRRKRWATDDWREIDGRAFGIGAAVPAPGTELERRKPARAGQLQSDLLVPLGQAFVSGLLALIVAWILGGWRWGLGAGLGVVCIAWVLLLADTRRGLWIIERAIRHDLDADGAIGPPTKTKPDPPVILRAPASHKTTGEPPQMPVTADVSSPNRKLALCLSEFVARGARDGLARSKWVGRKLSNGYTVSDGDWRRWTQWLREADLLEVSNAGTFLRVSTDEAVKAILHDWPGE